MVLKAEQINAAADEPIDGFLGADNLQNSALAFDFTRQELTLVDPAPVTPAQLALLGFHGAVAIPMPDPRQNLHYLVKAEFGSGISEELLVDTGAVRTQISRPTAMRLKLKPITLGREKSGFSGRSTVDYDRVPRFSLGPFSVEDLEVEYPQRDRPEELSSLGLDFLSRFRVLMDFKKECLYLAPQPKGDG